MAGGELVPALFPGEVLVCSGLPCCAARCRSPASLSKPFSSPPRTPPQPADPDVTYLDPIDGPVPGALYVTNFKVFFHVGTQASRMPGPSRAKPRLPFPLTPLRSPPPHA